MNHQIEDRRTRGTIPTCSTTQLMKPECSCQECLRQMLVQVGYLASDPPVLPVAHTA